MEFGNDTTEEWSVVNAPQKQDPTYYKVATGLLLTSAILTLALIQYFKRNKKNQRGQPCPGCQSKPLKDISESRMFPHSWRNLFPKKPVDSPRIGLLQGSMTPSQSQENSPNVRVRLKRRYRTNLALGNKLVDLSKHGYMVTRTKKARNDSAKPVTAISQTDIPGHSNSPRVQSLERTFSRTKRTLSSVSSPSRTAGPENRDPNMCQVDLYREMTKALRNNDLPRSSLHRSSRNLVHSADDLCHQRHREESIDGLNAIPLLQVNGVTYSHKEGSCVMDCACGLQDSDHFDHEEEEEDEGQLQCALKYDQKSSTLSLRSVCVKTSLDPGIPGFLVEVSLLPHNSQSARSKVYVTARREVDITLRETFRLRCTKDDIARNTLSIAVKPMFCSTILYAETDLNELTLISGKEIFLGGYLKSLSHHFN